MADHAKFPVEVLTPEGMIFDDEVEMLSTRTEVGEVGVLANHAPLLATLAPAELRLHISEGDVRRFAQGEGYLQVGRNRALVLVEECFDPARIDRAEQQRKLEQAEAEIAEILGGGAEERGSARYEHAVRDKRRAETFLRIAGGESQST
jgi:F-type H+-transporting ATPase subunit epsilon